MPPTIREKWRAYQAQQQVAETTSTDAVKASIDLLKAVADAEKTSTDSVKTAVDLVTAATNADKTSTDTVKTSTDAVKASVDLAKTSTDAVKTSTDLVKTAVDQVKAVLQSTIKFLLGSATKVTGAITTAASTVGIATDGCGVVTAYVSGAYVGVNLTFEQSPDSTNGTDGTWFPTNAANISSQSVVTATGVLTTNSSNAWEISAPGAAWVRVRATAWTSGSATVVLTATAAAYESAPPVQTHAVTESGTWTVGLSGALQSTAGTTPRKVLSAATTNATSVIAAAASMYGYSLANTTAAWKYFRLFNKASAPTVGTDSPLMVIPIPPGGAVQGHLTTPARFATGLAYAITGASPDNDATAVAVGDVVGFLLTS